MKVSEKMGKNIWIWNHYASDMYRNRGGRHYWFAQKLIQKGYDVTIFCSNTYHNSSDIIPIEENKDYTVKKIDKIKFVFIKTTSLQGRILYRIKNMYDFYKNIKKVSKEIIINGERPDYIIASSVHPLTMLAGIQIGEKYNIPCISEVRDLWPEAIFQFGYLKESGLLGKLLIAGEKYIYEKSNAMIFTKPGDYEYILEKKWDIKQGGKIDLNKVFYINNGVDLNNFEEQKSKYSIDDEDLSSTKFKVIYSGTIKPVNNIDLILDAAKKLNEYTDIVFLIYGSGSEERKISKRISEEKILNVKLKGRVNKKYIPYILSNSSVNLLNYSQSQYNWKRGNSSNKLFEYLASGTPVLSTVKMGYSIINKYECGYELKENTAQDLAKTILKIKNLQDGEYIKLSNNARLAANDFDFKLLAEKLVEVIKYVK